MGGAPKHGLRRLAVTGLDNGVVDPSPLQLNVSQPVMLAKAIEKVSETTGNGGGRTGLLLPDVVARVNVLDFETLPAKIKEMESLLRWRIKDSLGYSPEDAQLSYQELHRGPGFIELLVVAVKKDVLGQYLGVIEPLRGSPTLVLPATMALLPLLSDIEPGGQLLTHVCCGGVTHALVEGNRLRFWRSRRLPQQDEESTSNEVISEAARAVASVRDRLGLDVQRAWLCARPLAGEGLKQALRQALNVPVDDLPVDARFDSGLKPEEKPLLSMFAAPLAGIISNAGRSQ